MHFCTASVSTLLRSYQHIPNILQSTEAYEERDTSNIFERCDLKVSLVNKAIISEMHRRNMLRMIKHNTSVYEVFMAMNFKRIFLAECCSLITQTDTSLSLDVHSLYAFGWTRFALEVCDLLIIGQTHTRNRSVRIY